MNNIKWQINGVLNSYHKPEDKDSLQNNFGFQQEINEISKHVSFKKRMAEHMSRMSDLKLNMLVDKQKEKLGFINRKLDNEIKLSKLCEEIYQASKMNKKKKMSASPSPENEEYAAASQEDRINQTLPVIANERDDEQKFALIGRGSNSS